MKNSFLGFTGTIGIYALCVLIALYISYKHVKETKGLTDCEIDELFKLK
jgi:hypothetical protein